MGSFLKIAKTSTDTTWDTNVQFINDQNRFETSLAAAFDYQVGKSSTQLSFSHPVVLLQYVYPLGELQVRPNIYFLLVLAKNN